jgi:DNA-binding transcriptional LysR family regulator
MASNAMEHIELRLFRYFVTLAQELHFSRAAMRLGISPPTLTHQIQKLEQLVGTILLNRKKAGLSLTESGKRFLQHAREAIQQSDEAVRVARSTARGEVGRVEFGYLPSASGSGLLGRVLSDFQKEKPGIEINIRATSTMAQFKLILAKELDVGISSAPNQFPVGLTGFPVDRQPLMLAVPGDHPLAGREGAIDPSTLQDEPFVAPSVETDMGFERLTDAMWTLGGFTPKVHRRATDITSVLTLVSAGFGVAVVPRSLSTINVPNIVYRPLRNSDDAHFSSVFVYRLGETSAPTRAVIQYMTTHHLGMVSDGAPDIRIIADARHAPGGQIGILQVFGADDEHARGETPPLTTSY